MEYSKLKTCGVVDCHACTTHLCRTCSACKSKKRLTKRKCGRYQQQINACSKSEKICHSHRQFWTHGSLVRHEAKSQCGTVAKKWGSLPHKCLICEEEPLFENHECYIIHSNNQHDGKIRYSVRCPNILDCKAFVRPNNIIRHYSGHRGQN